jgi:hypothetical protein
MRAAGGHHSSVEIMNMAPGAGSWNGQGDEQMLWSSSHRRDVAEIRGCGAEADISHCGGSEVEVDPSVKRSVVSTIHWPTRRTTAASSPIP